MNYRTSSFLLFFILLSNVVPAQKLYTIKGKVSDQNDDSPLIGVSVVVSEAKLGGITDIDGKFIIINVPKGIYQVRFSYIGHSTVLAKVIVPSKDSQELNIKLTETAIHLNDVVITGNPFLIEDKDIVKPLVTLGNLDLDIVRNNSIGEMLNFQPGVSVISNGTAVSRPVIRGFGSNRVIILEDGLRMGDLSASSSDHSITEDGSSPDRIEIVRGASSLLYTNSSPGGVINIITDLIPTNIPSKLSGSISLGGSSISDQKFGNTELFYGSGRTSYEAGAFYRSGNSYRSPSGERVSNSDLSSKGLRGGVSFHPEWGTFGVGLNNIKNLYGIPYNQKGNDEEGPVFIDMMKTDYKAFLQIDTISSIFPQISIKTGFENYNHSEISRITQTAGSKFSLSTFTGDIFIKHNLFSSSPLVNSAIGFWGLNQKYKVRGEEALTPDADLSSAAIYLFEQFNFHPLDLQGALRYEFNSVKMPESVLSDSLFPAVKKTFNTFSSSLSLAYTIFENFSVFANVSNQLRTPTIEEMGSFSIHAALASFDIGSRNLKTENNYGFETGFRINEKKFFIELNAYYNLINNYIFRNPSSLFYENGNFNNYSGLPVFTYSQTNAEIFGAEFKGIIDLAEGFSTTITTDYVRGKYQDLDKNLPQIPPFRLSIEPKYVKDFYWFGLIWKGASAQRSIAENETMTKGYGVIDIYAGIKLFTGNLIHQFDFKTENVTNLEYREHLSALKNFAPMPGRNFLLTYKLLF